MSPMTSAREDLDTGVLTLCGPVRAENQDVAAVRPFDGGRVVAVVADGMGGHRGGREAAEIAVRTCFETLAAGGAAPSGVALDRALREAHHRIGEAARRNGTEGMGSTAVLAVVESGEKGPVLFLAHVGDSRAYLVRGRSLYRLTEDHSLVGQLVRDGHLQPEEAFGHPDSNVIHRALGQAAPVEPELKDPLPLDAGDRIVLCSDGIHGVLQDPELLAVLGRFDSAAAACKGLVEAALRAGSDDNLSVACIQIPSRQRSRQTRVDDEGGEP